MAVRTSEKGTDRERLLACFIASSRCCLTRVRFSLSVGDRLQDEVGEMEIGLSRGGDGMISYKNWPHSSCFSFACVGLGNLASAFRNAS